MKKTILLLTAVMMLAMTFSVSAQRTADKSVISTIKDSDANFMPYRLQSDLRGAYKNGVDSTESIIQGIGDWELDMLASPTRRVFVDFGDPLPNTNPSNVAPPPSAYYPVRFLSQCSARGKNLQTLALNTTVNCPVVLAVDYGTQRYSLRFNAVNYPGTNDVSWTCTSTVSGKCNGWRMQSDPNGLGKVSAQLLKITTVKGKTTEQAIGKYYFSFDITLTNP